MDLAEIFREGWTWHNLNFFWFCHLVNTVDKMDIAGVEVCIL